MALGLNKRWGPAPGVRRRAAWFALVLAVVLVHSCVTQAVAERMADLQAEPDMPARIEVAYVRDMELSAPPPTAAPAAPPPLAATAAPRAKPVKPAKAASAPEARPEPAEPVRAESAVPGPAIAGEALAAAPPMPVASAPDMMLAAAALPASASASAAQAGFEWPASTRMSYDLSGNFRGEVNGSAQVEWIRAGARYQVHVDLVVGPSGAPLISRRMSSDGEITAEGLVPRRYDQDTKVILRERRRQTVSFEPGTVVLANGERRDAVPGVQDTASQFVQLTYVFSTRPELLRVGGKVEIPLALPHRVDVWTYDVVDEETLATPFGPLSSIHLKPRRALRPGELSIEFWFAPQLRYLPVRIRIQQDAETYIDLLISKRPEMGG